MLAPAYIVSVADGVVEIYSQVEQDIAADIARRIVKTGYMTDTAKWQLKKAQEFGYLSKNVDKLLAEATGLSTKEIRRLMKEAGVKSLAYDDAIYTAAGLTPSAIENSPALQAMLLQGADTTLALIGNYTKTTGKVANLAFNNVLDRAYIQIISGAFSPNTAIKNAVKEIASKGIEKVAYPSGSYTGIESAVRRAVTTGVNQSTAKLQLARASEMECELVETSSHSGARPEHALWQGRVFCLKGKRSGYPNFYDATGYGTGAGLCGWNCYHSFYPYFEGLSTRSFSSDPSADAGSSNLVDYERSQKQRYYERQVRNAKKECVTINAAMDAAKTDALHDELYEQFQRSSVKLKNREAALKKFLQETGRTRTNEREWTAGFGHSVSSKAVLANKKAKKGG
jgi:hypothetical protein